MLGNSSATMGGSSCGSGVLGSKSATKGGSSACGSSAGGVSTTGSGLGSSITGGFGASRTHMAARSTNLLRRCSISLRRSSSCLRSLFRAARISGGTWTLVASGCFSAQPGAYFCRYSGMFGPKSRNTPTINPAKSSRPSKIYSRAFHQAKQVAAGVTGTTTGAFGVSGSGAGGGVRGGTGAAGQAAPARIMSSGMTPAWARTNPQQVTTG